MPMCSWISIPAPNQSSSRHLGFSCSAGEPARLAALRHFRDLFLAVVCGSGYGYRRADGIAVVPVGALGAVSRWAALTGLVWSG